MPSKTKKTSAHNKLPSNSYTNPSKRTLQEAFADHIDEEQLSLTVETLSDLSYLLTNSDADTHDRQRLYKRLKPLRSAIYDFTRASSVTINGSLTNRISEALADARWRDAQVLLAEFRIRREAIKLGTLQRWIRDADAASASGKSGDLDEEVMVTLHSILLTTNPAASPSKATHNGGKGNDRGHDQVSTTFMIEECIPSRSSGLNLREEVLSDQIYLLAAQPKSCLEWKSMLKIIDVTQAKQRKPPNQYDATIYTTTKAYLDNKTPNVTRSDIMQVPGAFLLHNILSADECRAIISLGEAVGFSPDCAVAGSATQQASILAHNFYYFADSHTLSQIYGRIRDLLPRMIDGRALKGLNARFRVYRYVPGAVYRPHIDGAWPRSGIDTSRAEGEQYMYDDQREGAQISRLTLLMYLNDEFADGHTTFFLPGHDRMMAYKIQPQLGAALVFPHGETAGALLHEGSGVSKGAKYVIRTDVLYEKDVTA